MVFNSRFLDQYNYAEKKAFTLDILKGLPFWAAINKHSAINISAGNYVHFTIGTFHSFMRSLKGSLLESSRNNTPEQTLEYKSLNLHAGIDYLREKRHLILSYIQLLENEFPQANFQSPSSLDQDQYHRHDPACGVYTGRRIFDEQRLDGTSTSHT